jgi:hypothetical protein
MAKTETFVVWQVRPARLDRGRQLLFDHAGLALDLGESHRLEDRVDVLVGVQVVDERERRGNHQEDEPAPVDRARFDAGRRDLVGRKSEQADPEELRDGHHRRAVRPLGTGLPHAQHDHRHVDDHVGGDPPEHAGEDELEKACAFGLAGQVHPHRDRGDDEDPDPGGPGGGKKPRERPRQLSGQRHAVEDAGYARNDGVERPDRSHDHQQAKPPLPCLSEDGDADVDRKRRSEGTEHVRGDIARCAEAVEDDGHCDERQPEEDARRNVTGGVLQLLRERAGVLDSDEREDGDPEERRKEAPREIEMR